MSERMCLRRRGRCWRGSTSVPNTTRSRKVSNTRELTQLGAFPKWVIFGPRHGTSKNSVKRKFNFAEFTFHALG